MKELEATTFPPKMKYNYAYDVSRFLDASIQEVVRTLIEAFLLVSLVVFLFFTRLPQYSYPSTCRAGSYHRYVRIHAPARIFD